MSDRLPEECGFPPPDDESPERFTPAPRVVAESLDEKLPNDVRKQIEAWIADVEHGTHQASHVAESVIELVEQTLSGPAPKDGSASAAMNTALPEDVRERIEVRLRESRDVVTDRKFGWSRDSVSLAARYIEDVTALLSGSPPSGDGVESFWLIERGQVSGSNQPSPIWYTDKNPDYPWTDDATKAERFATREDCERAIEIRDGINHVHHSFGVATEHTIMRGIARPASSGSPPAPTALPEDVRRKVAAGKAVTCGLDAALSILAALRDPSSPPAPTLNEDAT